MRRIVLGSIDKSSAKPDPISTNIIEGEDLRGTGRRGGMEELSTGPSTFPCRDLRFDRSYGSYGY